MRLRGRSGTSRITPAARACLRPRSWRSTRTTDPSCLWLGTYGGLTQFDGREFTTYTRRDGLSANAVRAIAEDAHGRLIVGTVGGGACLRGAAGFRCLGRAEGLPNDNVSALLPAPGGGFWVATEDGLARVADGLLVNRTYGPDDGLPGRMLTALARDRSGQMWVATDRGLARLDGDRFVTHPAPELAGAPITFLLGLADGLLIGTADRLYADRGGELEPVPVCSGVRIIDAARDGSGRLWVATDSGVVQGTAHGAPLLTRDHGLLNDAVNRAIVDREGNVWFGTESGLSRLTPGPFSQFTERDGLPHPFVRALAGDRLGRLWVGTRDGIAVQEHLRFQPLPLPGVPDPRVYALAPLPDGGMLVGTRRGLVHYDGGVRRLYLTSDGLPSAVVLSLQPDGDRGVWVGTSDGLAYWNAGRLHPAARHVDGKMFVVSLARDRIDRLWIGRRATGLGLATVYGIVNQNGWHIAVESEPGQGARFRIHLPLSYAPAGAAAQPALSSAVGRPGTDQVVLVAEDQDSVRKLVCQTLERKGYQVLVAHDGVTAVDLSGQYAGRIDLLLSDMIMPGLNGRQAAERITAQRPGIRVLFMSGHADGVLGRNGLIEDEHTQLIRKPFTPSELTDRVDKVVSAAGSSGGRGFNPDSG